MLFKVPSHFQGHGHNEPRLYFPISRSLRKERWRHTASRLAKCSLAAQRSKSVSHCPTRSLCVLRELTDTWMCLIEIYDKSFDLTGTLQDNHIHTQILPRDVKTNNVWPTKVSFNMLSHLSNVWCWLMLELGSYGWCEHWFPNFQTRVCMKRVVWGMVHVNLVRYQT